MKFLWHFICCLIFTVHLIGKYNGVVFEDREVKFDYGEGSDCGVVEGVEIALAKIPVGETSKYVHKKT